MKSDLKELFKFQNDSFLQLSTKQTLISGEIDVSTSIPKVIQSLETFDACLAPIFEKLSTFECGNEEVDLVRHQLTQFWRGATDVLQQFAQLKLEHLYTKLLMSSDKLSRFNTIKAFVLSPGSNTIGFCTPSLVSKFSTSIIGKSMDMIFCKSDLEVLFSSHKIVNVTLNINGTTVPSQAQTYLIDGHTVIQVMFEHEGESIGDDNCQVHNILQSIAAPVVVANASMEITYINPYGCHVFGYDMQDILGQKVNILMSSQQAEEHDNYVSNYRSGNSKIVGKGPRLVVGRHRDGRKLYLYLTITEFLGSFTAVFTDITAFRESQYKLENMISSVSIPILVLNNQTMKVVSGNKCAVSTFGYENDELVDMDISKIVLGENGSKYRWEVWSGRRHDGYVEVSEENGCKVQMRVVGSCPHAIETISKFGEKYSMHVSVYSAGDTFTAVFNNVTKAYEANRRLNQILAAINSPVVVANQHMIIEYVNETTETIFGYSKKELVGQRVNLLMEEADSKNHDAYVINYITGGEKKIVGKSPRLVHGKHKNGSRLHLYLTVTECESKFTAVFTDVTSVHQLQKRLSEQSIGPPDLE